MEESNKQIHSKENEDKLLNHRAAAWAFLVSREIAIEFHAILGISPKLFRPPYLDYCRFDAVPLIHTEYTTLTTTKMPRRQ